MTTVLRILDHTNSLGRFPALARYVDRHTARPAFRKALADQMRPFKETAARYETAGTVRQGKGLKTMSQIQGMPLWYELITEDPDAAEAFYGKVVGWTFSSPPGGLSRGYRVGSASDIPVTGLLPRPGGAPLPDSWVIYFGADDPDAVAEAARSKGGTIHMGGTDIPGVGRIALLADPQGVPFYLLRGTGDGGSRSFTQAGEALAGHVVWNELTTPDPAAAIGFYAEILGIRQEGAMPMGALGDYQFLHVGQTNIGAVMGGTSQGRTGWQVYFLVPDIDAAMKRLTEAGGMPIHGPGEIPGGAFSLVAEDPRGIRFGLVGRRV